MSIKIQNYTTELITLYVLLEFFSCYGIHTVLPEDSIGKNGGVLPYTHTGYIPQSLSILYYENNKRARKFTKRQFLSELPFHLYINKEAFAWLLLFLGKTEP